MPWAAAAVAGAAIVGGAMQADAAGDAAQIQADSSAAGIAEQRRQFDALQKILAPYAQAATGAPASAGGQFDATAYLTQHPEVAADPRWAADPYQHYLQIGKAQGWTEPLTQATAATRGSLDVQRDLVGLNGNDAQQAAISGIQSSPQFQAMLEQGQNSILQNASATGGLRGGNVQAVLAQFSPRLLSSLIDQQYSRLGGITSIGQNAAAGVGNAGMQSANSISTLLQQQGAALAGGELGQAKAYSGILNGLTSAFGSYMGGAF